LIRERNTEVVIRSKRVEGELSLDPLDSIWEGIEPVDVRLTGQVITRPRLQNPSIDFIIVRSIHNKEEIAFLLEWDDRFKNTTHQVPPEVQPSDTYPVLYDSQLPQAELRDAVAIQFPVKIIEGPQKPYFLYGNTASAVNLWMWKADEQEMSAKKRPVEELNAKGYDNPLVLQPPEGQDLRGKAIWEAGRWRVVFIRSLLSEDSGQDITFEKGKFIPLSFQAWDGANKEYGLRMSLSSWYYLLLETSTPFSVYIYTLIGIIAGVGLEFWLLRRLKRPAGPQPRST
jgi:DMSO reductase family type II enzyme heme b subunit